MLYDRELIAAKLNRWEKYLDGFNLPTWEELPAFELYMDQVVLLIQQYLNFLPSDEGGENLMPPPHKKRYGRIHIAYLIMICTLKQSLSIAYIQKLLPSELPEADVRQRYNDYVRKHKATCLCFIDAVRQESEMSLRPDSPHTDSVENFVFAAATISGFSKLLAEKIVKLQHMTGPADAPFPAE